MANPPKSNTGPFGIPPGGPWFIFQATGTIQRQSNPVLAMGLANSGWVGFATQAEAKAALAYSKSHGAPTVAQAAKNNIPGFSGIDAVGNFFNKLSEGNMWLRIGEFAIGAILVGVALAHLTGTDNAIAKTLRTGAKVVK
jgi:hypothetical protein